MPWDSESFQQHKRRMTEARSKKRARMANRILSSCLRKGGKQGDCERIAIATALKRLSSKRA